VTANYAVTAFFLYQIKTLRSEQFVEVARQCVDYHFGKTRIIDDLCKNVFVIQKICYGARPQKFVCGGESACVDESVDHAEYSVQPADVENNADYQTERSVDKARGAALFAIRGACRLDDDKQSKYGKKQTDYGKYRRRKEVCDHSRIIYCGIGYRLCHRKGQRVYKPCYLANENEQPGE